MASISDDKNNAESESLDSKKSITNAQKNAISVDENMTKSENASTDISDSSRPISICSPFISQNLYKPVFGSNRSILKPSALFTDANISSPTVTFGNSTSKTVKLKPAVLINPFVNSDSGIKNEFKSDCDEKKDLLPNAEGKIFIKENPSNSTFVSSPIFVPLNDTPSSTSSTTASSNNTSSPPVLLNSQTASEAKDNKTSVSVTSEFIFGQNIHERVNKIEANNAQESVTQNGITFSEMLFTSAMKQDKQKENASHEFSNGNTKTLSISAKEYEEARSIKRKYEEVAVVTGEEEEHNVLQINCKLFAFDNASSNWTERGRGTLRVNDKETAEGRSSRLIMRLIGNLRVVLNTKIWADMNVELASKKSVRLTAIDSDGQVRIYVVVSSPKDSEQLYNVLKTRIQRKKLKSTTEGTTATKVMKNS